MLLHYSMERILVPSSCSSRCKADWTEKGLEYREQCTRDGIQPRFVPSLHYVARPGRGRILLPDHSALCGLRHRWCWEVRARPHLLVWSFAKVPRADFSPEENARLLCVYMRPWTLDPLESSKNNPLLALLGKCTTIGHNLIPVWTQLPLEVTPAAWGSAHVPSSAGTLADLPEHGSEASSTKRGVKRNVRLRIKTEVR